jgi:hypothetical protein
MEMVPSSPEVTAGANRDGRFAMRAQPAGLRIRVVEKCVVSVIYAVFAHGENRVGGDPGDVA